ncbi:MAG: L-2-amino-thiazoline-4-carboxylic acid hydrolase [Thermoanaerobaculia bacterium]|nr:L-2-amino-thiazoline-4-carboxylic acid hydrolase [Thermoanaerobaculia bacterium]
MSENPILRAIKTQSKIVIPIVKELEKELGKERAHAIVGRAIAQSYADYKRDQGFELDSHPGSDRETAFPVERKVVEDTDTSFGFDITACEFADYFKSIGEPEIGALMTCGVDFAAEELVRPGWEFRRTQTQMQGAPHCDFRWKRRNAD